MLNPLPRPGKNAPCTIDEAQARIVAFAPPPTGEQVALIDACGRIVAASARATRAQPPFPSAAMDGWAVAGCDAGLYRIVGESRAGRAFSRSLAQGEAVAISTGAPMPGGAARVVRREQAIERGRLVDVPEGAFDADVRPLGSDFDMGNVLSVPGERIDALTVARLMAAGIGEVVVARRPTLAILATGDELAAGGAPRAYQIWDALSLPIALRARAAGAHCTAMRHVGDAENALEDALAAIGSTDIIVIVGGASGGRHDHARASLAAMGLEQAVPAVRMKPGKPFWSGRIAHGPAVIGLPGNPVATLACVELFLLPLIRAWQGASEIAPVVTVHAPKDAGAASALERVTFARIGRDAAGRAVAQPLGGTDSAALSPISGANALLRPARGQAITLL